MGKHTYEMRDALEDWSRHLSTIIDSVPPAEGISDLIARGKP